jgi:uncharacterized protein YjdB
MPPRPNVLRPNASPAATMSYTLNQVKTIYGLPSPSPTAGPVTVGVFSFGGSLVGTLANGVLTNGDVQKQWSRLGIRPENHPRVLIVPVNGARIVASRNDNSATIENTLDVETIGAMCPTSKLTIILYIARPTDNFPVMLSAVLRPVTVAGQTYTPSIISCSWGAPESDYTPAELNSINETLRIAASRGITITAATGDNGSSDGTPFTVADFPSSSPYVVACGGTTLRCPRGIYDASTVETSWPRGGGGIARVFDKPAYQAALPGTKRSTPDIALVADPNTGIQYTYYGKSGVVIGGTSVVAPIIAGFAAAINLTQPLTPLLYTCPPSNFNDVLTGSNGAYSAKQGHDNCTGLGSIVGHLLVSSITTPVPVSGITLAAGSTTVLVGQTLQLLATIAPTTATNKTYTFTSANTAVATVSPRGLVTGISVGTATMTVTSADGGFTASITITVPLIHVTGITVASSSLPTGQSAQVSYTVQPATATNKSVTFSSSNPAVATVSPSGRLQTGTSVGTTTITVTSVDGGYTASAPISVILANVTGISLNKTALRIRRGTSETLIATVTPPYAINKAVTWTSSNPWVSVKDGRVYGSAAGISRITARTQEGGYLASCSVMIAR